MKLWTRCVLCGLLSGLIITSLPFSTYVAQANSQAARRIVVASSALNNNAMMLDTPEARLAVPGDGLSGAGSQLFTQDTEGVPGVAEAGDLMGSELAAADFNGDGFGDLVVGVPGEDIEGEPDVGAVFILYGSATGLTSEDSQIFTQDTEGVPGAAEAGDLFGSTIAGGDFNGDGYSDLAVGALGEDLEGVANAGAIIILYGSAAGLTGEGSQLFTQDTEGIPGVAEVGDVMGNEVIAGNFNGDAFSDLAVGSQGEAIGAEGSAGAVIILYGSAAGLTSEDSQLFSQDSEGVPGVAQAGDFMGHELAATDFNGDGFGDLVVGVPGEDIEGEPDAGAILIFYGSANGVQGTGSQLFSQNTEGIPGVAETSDRFGDHVTTGNFDGDGYGDLAAGAPGEDIGEVEGTGTVFVLYGSANGVQGTGSQLFSQDTEGIPGVAEAGDRFGYSVDAGDFDGDGYSDLAVGALDEDIEDATNVGAVIILYGSANGVQGTGSQFFSQDTEGIPGIPEPGDQFGFGVEAGDFNGDRYSDLAVGAPGEGIGEEINAGAVFMLYAVPGVGSLIYVPLVQNP